MQAMEAGTNFQILSLILQIKLQNRLLGFAQTQHTAQKLCWLRILMDAEQVDF